MKTEAKPTITVSFAVDVDLEYNSFTDGTPQELAQRVEDDVINAVLDTRPEILGVFTSITSVCQNG